ncbi:TPA: long-chain fatty acid--CoA ligase [candidate division CPR2 bacterium]|uniref:Long-chain fatty-acid-CoA ligase n=1 Tax=candidate division CPR2 bacterium GW2011_GWC1_41_48 TaxID=1618344 RepID=A0A0G0W848_UNCC2|nr:MAG: Long-chain fatty-acid-CoA ligase [candidate division CPR2 bacterium GW2011_GWC2_39_35]KKR27128.1 MAG: Long-chain fatty-acid-CoA ligase [candidate division CPR2 bacterium GW2011_GWD1_39_7]KKR29197.1 MAG: Long-chain fatty-acid-CoA ligase [candidate division CPR2 bacterium GW2011_GWD2_39_7]KKS09159.1 MAG: Long-chain fatty-acid-CoA ligase [candidate division CPR2 bacterium GW2011_GWC1_41_48]OGB57247.1 MAG: hypothetical protein A2Y27_03675 [candidate division CPR2 bacterium GWD1_39_7]OGB707
MDQTTIDTIPKLFLETADKFPDRPAIYYKKGHLFDEIPYKRLKNLVGNFTLSLEKMGVKKGDPVILISENRPEWVVLDLAIQFAGAINVPIHNILTSIQIKQIVDEIEPALIVVSNREALKKVLEIEWVLDKKIPIIFLDDSLTGEQDLIKKFNGQHFVGTLKLSGHYHTGDELERRLKNINSSDVASIIYTSGTTGHPKGVELTQTNFISNIYAVLEAVKLYPEDKLLSILPLSHVFERTAGYYVPLAAGASITYIEDISKLSEYAKEEKPTVILAVPRLYEKIYEKVWANASKSPVKKMILKFALDYGKDKKHRSTVLYKLLDRIVFSKIKENFGGNIRFFVSGGASLASWLGDFFDSMGMPVLEGYGLTETSPVVTCNRYENYKYGTIGPALTDVQVKISGDGEILVKGPNVMKSYYKNEEASKGAFTKDGWFKTGDLGNVDKDGFFKIAGRKKEIIVLTTGKKIFPVPIEEALESSVYLDQAFMFGDGFKHIGAVIVPSEIAIEKFGENIEERLAGEINEQLKHFSKIEQIKKFIISTESFTVENGLLTPTMKLRRGVILEKYADKIEDLYSVRM